MRPPPVVVRLDELDDCVPGLGPGGESPAVVHLVLQRGEERLGDGVVVAVSRAAAGKPHVVGARPFGQKPAGVLRAAVRVEYGVARHVSSRFGGFQRRHRDVGGHAARQRPPDHHARVQVDHGRQVQPALAGAQVGDVAHELVGGDRAREVAAHQVGPGLGLGVGNRGALALVWRAAAYAQLAHQLAHPIQGQSGELGGQEALHEPRAEPAVRLQPDAPHGGARGPPPPSLLSCESVLKVNHELSVSQPPVANRHGPLL